MRMRLFAAATVLALTASTWAATPAKANGSMSLSLYAVGAPGADGTAPVWLGGNCSAGATEAYLSFDSEVAEPQAVAMEEVLEVEPAESPEPIEPEASPSYRYDVSLTLDSQGNFEYIYETVGQQYVTAICVYPNDSLTASLPVDASTPSGPQVSATGDGQDAAIYPGGTITISLSGFTGGQDFTVFMHSTPRQIASGTVGANGTVRQTATIPADATPGLHHLTIRGATGQRAIVSFLIITPPVAPTPGAAATGSSTGPVTPTSAKDKPLPSVKHALTINSTIPAPLSIRAPRLFRPSLPDTGVVEA